MRRLILAVFCTLAACCYRISTERSVYAPIAMRAGDSVAVTFAYAPGRIEESSGSSGRSTRRVEGGQSTRFLGLRDDIQFALRDAGLPIASEQRATYLIELTPTVRETDCALKCNVIETLAFVVTRRGAPDTPLARVRFENPSGGHATGNDREFSKRATEELLVLFQKRTR